MSPSSRSGRTTPERASRSLQRWRGLPVRTRLMSLLVLLTTLTLVVSGGTVAQSVVSTESACAWTAATMSCKSRATSATARWT